jgi:hypothetical protein
MIITMTASVIIVVFNDGTITVEKIGMALGAIFVASAAVLSTPDRLPKKKGNAYRPSRMHEEEMPVEKLDINTPPPLWNEEDIVPSINTHDYKKRFY